MSTEDFTKYFQIQRYTKIDGPPNYIKLHKLFEEVKSNARSVPSSRGGGTLGMLGLVLSTVKYATLAPGTPFENVAPAALVIPPRATVGAIFTLQNQHQSEKREFERVNQLEALLKSKICEAIDDQYLTSFKDADAGCVILPIRYFIAQLFTKYGEVTSKTLKDAEDEVRGFNFLLQDDINIIYKKIEELKLLGEAANNPYSDRQLLDYALEIIKNTHDMESSLKDWYKKPDADQTWTNFKTHFEAKLKELRNIRGTSMRGTAYHQAHLATTTVMNAQTQQMYKDMHEIQEAILMALQQAEKTPDQENDANRANTNSANFTQQQAQDVIKVMENLKQEVAGMKRSMAKSSKKEDDPPPTGTGRKRNRNGAYKKDPNVDYSIPFWERPGSDHKYCWTCGPNKSHESKDCPRKKNNPQHKDNATFQNRMGGNTRGIVAKFL